MSKLLNDLATAGHECAMRLRGEYHDKIITYVELYNQAVISGEIDGPVGFRERLITVEVDRLVKEAEEHKSEMNKLFKKLDEVIQDRLSVLLANHNLSIIINDVKRHTEPCVDGVGKFIKDRIADFESPRSDA